MAGNFNNYLKDDSNGEYFVIECDEDGDVSISNYSKKDLKEEILNDRDEIDNEYTIIIKGKRVFPFDKKTVVEKDIE
jgi:hypothetical protein